VEQMECDWNVGKVEREENDVCRRFTQQRAMVFHGVLIAVRHST